MDSINDSIFVWKDGINGKKYPCIVTLDGHELSIFDFFRIVEEINESQLELDPELARRFFCDATRFITLITAFMDVYFGRITLSDVDPSVVELMSFEPGTSIWEIMMSVTTHTHKLVKEKKLSDMH